MFTKALSPAVAVRREHLLRAGVRFAIITRMPESGSTQQSLCVEPNKWGYDRG